MYQIDNSTVASSIPASTAAGLAGFFTDGDPVLNTPPTVLPAEFMNMLMMELLNVLVAAGVTPSKTSFTQLAIAISQLIRSGAAIYGIDAGIANVYVVPYTPAVTGAVDGMVIRFQAKTTNTGPSTFAPDALAANPLIGLGSMPLQGGEIVAGGTCTVVWLAALSKWVLLSCTGGSIQAAPGVYAADTGSANSYAAAFTPAISVLTDGAKLTFQALTANTGASTLNVNGLGATPLIGGAQQPLQGGEIIVGGKAEVVYHSSLDSWILWTGGGSPQVPTATKSLHAVNMAQLSNSYITYFMGQI